jgi:hypothetical protein
MKAGLVPESRIDFLVNRLVPIMPNASARTIQIEPGLYLLRLLDPASASPPAIQTVFLSAYTRAKR